MSASVSDWKWTAACVGFTFGFGLLTLWTIIQQSIAVRAPLKSTYLFLVWGELISNVVISVVALVNVEYLTDHVTPGIPTYLSTVIFGSLETQLYLQILINRAALMGPKKHELARIKWGSALLFVILQTVVFATWYPGVLQISPFNKLLKFFNYGLKAMFLIVDVLLNYWFVRVVQRYLKKKERYEYTSLWRFNIFLIIINVILDCFLLGSPRFKNPMVYMQTHPLIFTLKLTIELNLANLVARLTRGSDSDEHWSYFPATAFSEPESDRILLRNDILYQHSSTFLLPNGPRRVQNVITSATDTEVAKRREGISGLQATKEVMVTVEQFAIMDGSSGERGSHGMGRVYTRKRNEASVDDSDSMDRRASQKWNTPELSDMTLDTAIFDDLPGQSRR